MIGMGCDVVVAFTQPTAMNRTPPASLDRPHVTGRVQYPRLHVGGITGLVTWSPLRRTPDPSLDRLHVTGRPPFPRAHVGGLPVDARVIPLSLGADGGMLYGIRAVPKPTPAAPPRMSGLVIVAGPFPTQYAGLRAYYHGRVNDLCMVAEADAPTDTGGVIKVRKSGTTYAVYLVPTTDTNASPIRVRTTKGTYAIREKTG